MAVGVGQLAPEFNLFDTDKKAKTLADFSGKNKVIAFFPGAFTGVCTKEMCEFRDSMANLNNLNAEVLGVSVDGVFSNKAFAAQNNLQFTVLSDYRREAVKAYGVELNDFAGLPGYVAAKRSIFVLDKSNVVRYAWISDNPGVEPNYAEISQALSALK